MGDPDTAEVVAALSAPVEPGLLRVPDLSRRRFLQAAGVASVATLLPAWLAEAAASAAPLGADEGVLVLLTLAGGNDGLNTFAPVGDGAYRSARGSLAISASAGLAMTGDRSLHPNLGYTKSLWDQGRLAVIEGVGQDGATLSHFVSMAQKMAANGNGQPGSSGWLGRVLDGLPHEPLTGVSIGSRVPLVVQGRHTRASAVPRRGSDLRQLDTSDPVASMQYQAVRAMSTSSGLGALGDTVAASFGQAIDLADRLRPLIPEEGDDAEVVTEMRLAARLINANLGIRVISIMFGDFDTHANQAWMHGQRMTELDAALRAFHETLDPAFADRALVVGTSEFGRRVRANNNGTDHGTANSLFAIGTRVNGGFWGQAPSLTSLDRYGNLVPTVDYRQVYGNLVETWLGADQAEVLGRDWADLGFLRSPGGTGGSSGGPGASPGSTPTGQRAEVARLYLAYFLRRPDEEGFEYWAGLRRSGRSLAAISNDFATSGEFTQRYGSLSNRQFVELVYGNVLGRSPDAGGLAHWVSVLDRGAPRGQVMLGFSESNEFRARTADQVAQIEATGPVGRLYRAYFLRAPDTAGLHYWIDTGLPLAAISEQFAASVEFRNRYGSLDDQAFIATAYRNVLGRDPDPGGLRHWQGILRSGTSRGAVMLGFSNSPEFVRKVQS